MTALEKWKNDFKEFISELSIPRDDYKGIMEYINEVPNEALEQKPCDDCISRQAVDELSKELVHTTRDKADFLCNFWEGLQKLPPVTPKEKTGHWILQPSNKEQGERDFIWWKCSECGQVIFSETKKDRREYHAYCGRCGARMVSE